MNFAVLRLDLEREASQEQTYPVCLTSRQCLDLLAVAECAERFVATTTYYRQNKSSRKEFEDLAVSILKAHGQI